MALSLDLRQRALDAYARAEGTLETIAARFSVSPASLSRWRRRARVTGSPARSLTRSGPSQRRVTSEGEALVRLWIQEDPSTTQAALAERLGAAGQALVCQQTLSRALGRMGITLKKSRSGPSSAFAPTSLTSARPS